MSVRLNQTIDYEKIQSYMSTYGKYILDCIRNEYGSSLSEEQIKNIDWLLNQNEFIVVEKPSIEDMEFFSKQEGITNPEELSVDYVPSAHGGRTKNDNKIHIYPYSKSFQNCANEDEIIKACLDDIIIHEIFHYFIRPNIEDVNNPIKNEFGHFLTEGLVQHYAEEFAKKHNLGSPKSNYVKNVDLAKALLSGFPKDMRKHDVDKSVFNLNQDELLKLSSSGDALYQEFVQDKRFLENVSSIIRESGSVLNMSEVQVKEIIKHFQNKPKNEIIEELSQLLKQAFREDEENLELFTSKLNSLTTDLSLQKEIDQYESRMKEYLPLEEQVKKMKHNGMSKEKIDSFLGENVKILNEVPAVLYHGSPESLDVLKPRESTQKGSYVYATDNPIHAIFFSIFRNSSIARGHINEYIDENGKYQVKYEIDERVAGALNELISDRLITVHVCDGKDFFKPQGEAFISREWVSKEGTSVVPTKKINVNIKSFFESLEKQGLVEYNRYSKDKDWQTVMDLLGQNYPFGLNTERAQNIEEFDAMYDELIATNFPGQFEFSKFFREQVKAIMFSEETTGLSLEEKHNKKLQYVRDLAQSFLTKTIDQSGKATYMGNIDKINEFMSQQQMIQPNDNLGQKL